jgi:TRAP-type C4-dicarboxylate transport system permease small subunit
LTSKLSPSVQVVIAKITQIFGTILFGLTSWQCAYYATKLWRSGELSATLNVPYFPIVYGLAFSSAVVFFVLLADVFKR